MEQLTPQPETNFNSGVPRGVVNGAAVKWLVSALWLLCLLIGQKTQAAPLSPDWQWARKATGAANSGSGMATDAEGNIYSTGSYSGSVTFDTITLTTNNVGLFLAKYDSSGNVLWAKTIGRTQGGASNGIALDASGNIYLAGSYTNGTEFSGVLLTNQGAHDAFVAKFSPTGNMVWVRRMGGTGTDQATGVALNSISEVMITGIFENSANFGGLYATSAGGPDVFVAKYSAIGTAVWVSRAGGADQDFSLRICSGPNNSAFLCGQFRGSAGFGNQTLNSQGGLDGFIARINAAGGFAWAAGFGGTEEDAALCVRTDVAGNPLITGRFFGTAGFGNQSLTAAGNYDAFLAGYHANGSLLWAKAFGGPNYETATSFFLDANQRITVAGSYQAQTWIGNQALTSVGSEDLFIAGFTATGDALWAKTAGGTAADYSADLVLDNGANCYLSGICFGPSAFGPISLPGVGTGAFIARLNSQLLAVPAPENTAPAVQLFPNPASNNVQLFVQGSAGQAVEVQVATVTGATVLVHRYVAQANAAPGLLMLPAQLLPGVYVVRVTVGTKTTSLRLVQQ